MFFSDYSHNSLVAQGTAEIIEAAQADKAFLRVTSYSIANASGASIWSHSWRVMPGIISWNGDGTVAGQPYQAVLSMEMFALSGKHLHR